MRGSSRAARRRGFARGLCTSKQHSWRGPSVACGSRHGRYNAAAVRGVHRVALPDRAIDSRWTWAAEAGSGFRLSCVAVAARLYFSAWTELRLAGVPLARVARVLRVSPAG